VERGIEQNRHAGYFAKLHKQLPKRSVSLLTDGLDARKTVAKHRGRYQAAAALLYSAHRLNKLGQRAWLKEVSDFFFGDRGRERAEVFAMFYVAVQVVAHHFVQRRRKNASRAEPPRAKLLRASKPPDNFPASQQLRHLVDQPLFGLDVLIIEFAVVEHRF